MKRTLTGLLVVALTTSLGGCVFVEKKPHPNKAEKRSHGCKPSQHWDGEMCRHNGKGKGARKHDG